MFKKTKTFMQDMFPKQCKFCGKKAVVKCEKKHEHAEIYLCSNCLRGFRFREKEFFKSVLPYGSYK